jgi:hypothetical protein
MPICLRLFEDCVRAAASRTFCTAGRRSPMRTAMMAITTSSSISVKPRQRKRRTRNWGMKSTSRMESDANNRESGYPRAIVGPYPPTVKGICGFSKAFAGK